MKQLIKKLRPVVINNYVYANENPEQQPQPVLSRDLTLKIFDEDKPTGINIIDRNKNKQNICYAVFEKEHLVHISWVYKTNLLLKQLGYNKLYYAVASVTYQNYRGKGIYPAILCMIAHNYPDKKLLGFVDIQNNSSRRAFEKAGFKKVCRFRLIRFLGIKIYLKKYVD